MPLSLTDINVSTPDDGLGTTLYAAGGIINANNTAIETADGANFKHDGSVDMTGQFRTDVGTFDSDVADGASAVAYSFDTQVTYATTGAKLASWKNNTTEKAYIDKDGYLFPIRVSWNIDSYLYEGATNRIGLVSGGGAGATTAKIIFSSATFPTSNQVNFANRGITQPLGYAFYIGNQEGSCFPTTDVAVPDIYLHALNARTVASTNIDGASVHVEGGDGATDSVGDADGGHVYLDGGQGYGTGAAGDVFIGNTRGNLVLGATAGIKSNKADGAAAVAFDFNSNVTLATAGAKLASFKNNATEKLFISKDGYIEHASWRLDESASSGKLGIYSDGDIDLRPLNATNVSKLTLSVVSSKFQFVTTAANGMLLAATGAGGLILQSAGTDYISFFGATAVTRQSGTGETTGFTAGAGTAVNDDSTFTGNVGSTAYRINDIVKALKNYGLLAA